MTTGCQVVQYLTEAGVMSGCLVLDGNVVPVDSLVMSVGTAAALGSAVAGLISFAVVYLGLIWSRGKK